MSTYFSGLNNLPITPARQSLISKTTFLKGFRQGDIITGRVVDQFSPSQYLVRVRGRDIVAESKIALKTDTVYTMQVQSAYPDFTINVIPGAQKPGNSAQISAILRQLNIDISDTSRAVVLELLRMDLPVTREAVLSVLHYMEQLFEEKKSRNERNQARSIIMLKTKGIPVSRNALQTVLRFIDNPARLPEDIMLLRDDVLMEEFPAGMRTLRQGFLPDIENCCDHDVTVQCLKQYMQKLGDLYMGLFTELLKQLNNISGSPDSLKYILSIMNLIQGMKLVHYKAPFEDQVYYMPFLLPAQDGNIIVEFYCRRMCSYPENEETVPGFEIHLFITINESPPLHVSFIKKTPGKIRIHFKHPLKSNLDLLKVRFPLIKQTLRCLGYRTVRVTEEIAGTDAPDYKIDLLFPAKKIVKSINITS
ncbi:hypothetical protein ACFL6I_18345 [candidate division KSB1 bacterium]